MGSRLRAATGAGARRWSGFDRAWRPSRAALGAAWLAVGLSAVAAGAFLAAWTPPEAAASSICVFRRVLGVDCPGCGMTRALSLLAHGHWGAALLKHPLAPFAVLEAALLWAAAGMALARGRLPAPGWGRVNALLIANAAIFYGVWIARSVL